MSFVPPRLVVLKSFGLLASCFFGDFRFALELRRFDLSGVPCLVIFDGKSDEVLRFALLSCFVQAADLCRFPPFIHETAPVSQNLFGGVEASNGMKHR